MVGCVDLLKSGAKVDLSYFDENSRQNVESDIIRIKPVYFLWVLVLIAVIILSIFMFRRISDNIYVLKHKWSIKKEQRERFREHKLTDKITEVLDNPVIDENRIATEVVIYADKICVDEETVRLKSHISSTKKILEDGGSVGRKLDFIAQEMNREANTILSKANSLDVSDKAIQLKTDIEKVREQIQNLE